MCIGAEFFRCAYNKIRIGLYVAAADPSAQLMQVSQSEVMRFVDDYRINPGHIDSGFNYRSREQAVVFAIDELDNSLLGDRFFHFPVQRANSYTREEPGSV